MIKLTLPWPPSVNRYWRSVNGRVLIAAAGRKYRTDVGLIVMLGSRETMGAAPVSVTIDAWYPDMRKRDLDNTLKAPLDALTGAGVWFDDSQIEQILIRKRGIDREKPRLEIRIDRLSETLAGFGDLSRVEEKQGATTGTGGLGHEG